MKGMRCNEKSDNIETMINDEADEVMEALLISK